MKNTHTALLKKISATLCMLSFCLFSFSQVDSVSMTFSVTALTYQNDASNSDLLTGITPSTTGWNTSGGAAVSELTDGIHGDDYTVAGSTVEGAWTTAGATATYDLGVGSNGAGYNIDSIVSIADWNSAGFGNQGWTIEVQSVGGAYTTLYTVDYQPLGGAEDGTTEVVLANSNGTITTGIEKIKITANSVNAGANGGAFVWRELDVFGVSTPVCDYSVTPLTYQNDVSNSDLLTSITPSTTGWDNTNGASVSQLTDGVHGGNVSVVTTVEGAWTTVGATATYDLGTGTNGTGFDLDSIISIADWESSGFGNQNWTIEVKPVGGDYTTLYTADCQSLGVGAGATKVVVGADSEILATGIQYIRITANEVNGGGFAWRELDVFGVSADSIPPIICVLKIMPMGNSITAGYTDNPTWSHLFNFGYRGYLYTSLTNAGYDVQYQGSSPEPWDSKWGDPSFGGTYSPPFDLRTISQDNHHGYGAQTATFLNANIATWLAAEVPDIILLKVGTNAQDQAGANTLVNYITTNYPSIHVIIAQIIPKFSYQQGIVDYNNYIKNTLVPTYQALGKNVTTADLYAPFLTDPGDLTSIDVSLFSNGINHPDDDGYILIAQAWENAINELCLCVTGTDTRTACDSLVWIDGNTYTANNSTATHNLVGQGANGCDSLVTLNLTINTVNTGVTQNQADLSSDVIGGNYQWLDCNNSMGVIPNDTNQNYSASINGSYAVEVEENGCIDTSSCLVVITVGMDEPWDDSKITTHNTTITIKGKGKATIYNLTGQRVHHSKITGNTSISLDKGIYLVKVTDGRRSVTKKVYLQ